jgi:hypothetical protein
MAFFSEARLDTRTDFESLPLLTFASSSSSSIDLNFHLINTQVTDITTHPNVMLPPPQRVAGTRLLWTRIPKFRVLKAADEIAPRQKL